MTHTSISAHDLTKTYGARSVLGGVSLSAYPGQRLGLVGENGVGKSTLLRLLAGVEDLDSGEVSRPVDTGFLYQELPFGAEARVGEVLEDALCKVRAIERRLEELADELRHSPDDLQILTAYGETLQSAETHEVWDTDRRTNQVLAGLGLDCVDRERRLSSLSGGEGSRLALAALLVRRPQALLLDEPTNHLDDGAVWFLEDYLIRFPGVVVTASHDRTFLEAVCTGICDLDPAREDASHGVTRGGVTLYGGAYSHYLRAKGAERRRWEQDFRHRQQEISTLRSAVATKAREVSHAKSMKDRNKMAYDQHGTQVQKAISRRVRNAQNRLKELLDNPIPKPPAPLQFSGFAGSADTGADLAVEYGPVLSLRDVRIRDRLEISRLDLSPRERLLVTGPNGAGKSTLLAVLAGGMRPDKGVVERCSGLRVGMLEQDVWFPEPHRSAREVYSAHTAAERRSGDDFSLADLGLLSPRDLDRPVGMLSVGQRRRLALALLVARTPHVLLLDEPTNHLSLSLVEELEEAFSTAPGAIVAATHDRWLRQRWEGPELRLVEGRRLESADGHGSVPPMAARTR